MSRKNPRRRGSMKPSAMRFVDPKSIVANVPVKIIEKPLQLHLSIDSGKVVIRFHDGCGSPVSRDCVVFSPEEAVEIGVHLFKMGRKLKPELAPDAVQKAAMEPTNAPIIMPGQPQ